MTTDAALLGFVAADAQVRRRAIVALAGRELVDDTVVFALRRLLLADDDVAVRALAAGALGRAGIDARDAGAPREAGERSDGDTTREVRETTAACCQDWLLAGLDDASPVVRDAVIRALARRRGSCHGDVLARLCELAAGDHAWWVRRAAIYALGVLAGDDAIAPARAALGDPFWRVRHAAVQVLALLGARSPERRPEIVAGVEGGTSDYLRTLWGPVLISEAMPIPIASRLPEALRDRDPAVVAARLAELADPPALALVELLCDPHQALRELAARRMLELGDPDAMRAALHWLDEPRIPHVAATVTAMLDGLGDVARELVCGVLGDPSARRGALGWAIGWVVATHDDELGPVAWQRAQAAGMPELALPLADDESVAALLRSSRRAIAIAAADELAMRRVLPPSLDALERYAGDVRMRLVALAGECGDWPRVWATASDPHDGTRGVALAYLARDGRLDAEQRRRALADRDPGVREAVLFGASVAMLDELLARERDPWVRRTAARLRLRPGAGGAVPALLAERDPWIRAHAVASLESAGDVALLLEHAADPDPMVQAAVIDRLAAVPDDVLAASLACETLSGGAQAATRAWLAAAAMPEAAPAIAPTARVADESVVRDDVDVDVEVDVDVDAHALDLRREHQDATKRAHPHEGRGTYAVSPAAALLERRTFGCSGITVTPLVISGAFDLQPGSLRQAADAGVELFFWEPTYAAMTRFLRARRQRHRALVVTGTYHADAASITTDVDRALRRLRRDTLDIFLLFWARSPARLDDAAFTALARLQQAGKIRATGFSTHDRALAISALERAPWDVVMTRHSAAHPGIETELLPRARATGAGVLTFSALCYGRMVSGDRAPSAADCYRYSLGQPGVTACISAPRRHRELVENLEVLARPSLDATRIAELRAHGAAVRIENQRFNTLIRQPTRDAAAAAMAMLEAELPPEDREDTACTTAASLGRSLHSRGRGRASLPSAMLRRGRL